MLLHKLGESIGWFNSDGTGLGIVLIGIAMIVAGFVVMYKTSKRP